MKNKKTFLVLIVLFALLVGGAYALYSSLSQDVAPQQMIVHDTPQPAGDAETPDAAQEEAHAAHAPDFTVYDRNGNEVRFSQFAGKPTVLNFWASWCSSCVHEMPAFQEKYAELGDSVNFVMINKTDGTRDTVEKASAFIDKNGYGFTVLYDTAANAIDAFGLRSLPTTYFIDAGGHIIAQATGELDAAALQQGIDAIT